jgi:hypothetical protein
MKDRKKAEITLAYEKVASLCARTQLFTGWTRQAIWNLIKGSFEQNPREMIDLLPPQLSDKRRKGRHWSSGYCYIIAEVAKIMLCGAGFAYKSFVSPNPRKKACKTHWVLIKDREVFDPKRVEPSFSRYSRFRGKAFQFRHPSKRAMTLFERVLKFGLSNSQVGFQKDRIAVAEELLSRIPDFRLALKTAEQKHSRTRS